MGRLRTLSDPLLRAIDEVAGWSEGEPGSLPRGVIDLSTKFTRGRSAPAEAYLEEPHLRAAYLAYYLPVNLAKVQALLEEMPRPASVPPETDQPIRVLDVGSGPGTAALAFLDWKQRQPELRGRQAEVVSVDWSAFALRESERLWQAYAGANAGGTARLVTCHGDATRSDLRRFLAGRGGFYDLIVVANILNELFRTNRDPVKRRVALVKELLGHLQQHGTMMILEPALRDTSRDLLSIRDRLLADGACTVYSPCLHDGPCPALVKEDDWCHEERPWTPSLGVAAIDREVGFIKDALKFSYLLLRKDGQTILPRASGVYRVVSELRSMKGEQRAWLCNATGRPEVGRLDRERSSTNAAMDDWRRGAIVRIDQIVRKNRESLGRIPASASLHNIKCV